MPLFHSRQEATVQPVVQEPVAQKHGLFHSRREPVAEPVVAAPAAKKHGVFHTRRDPSPARTTSTTSSGTTGGGHELRSKRGSLFRRSHDDGAPVVVEDSTHRSSPSLLHKGLNRMGMGGADERDLDPSIIRAREHVMSAEAAEEEADRALAEAKRRVREAHEHVRRLEDEAAEDARRAKIKQHHAAEVSKRGKVLGRKCDETRACDACVCSGANNFALGHGP